MSSVCGKCGAFGDMPHVWVEGDCVLPHLDHHRATVGHCCAGCVDRQKGWLTEIVELYATLEHVIDPASIPDDTAEHKRPKKQPVSPAPLRLAAWAMLNDRDRLMAFTLDEQGHGVPAYLGSTLPDVPAVLEGWASWAVESGADATSDDLGSVTSATIQLSAAAEHVARQPWIDEYDAELGWMRRTLRATHGITDPQALGRCITVTDGKECHGHVWPSTDTDPRPKCDRCRRRYRTLDLVRLKAMGRQAG